MKDTYFITFFLLLFITRVGVASWSMNDVSFLLPLPTSLTDSSLLTPSTEGLGGELFPYDDLKFVPILLKTPPVLPSELTVVGIRIDPCFPQYDPRHPENCHRQIRMVWQHLNESGGVVSTGDAAMHTFYELSPKAFQTFTEELSLLNQNEVLGSNLPLNVHPTISTQGLSGKFWTQLRKLLLRYCGGSNLIRFTFMTEEIPGQMWDFGGFDIVNRKLTRMLIPRIKKLEQSFINTDDSPAGFKVGAKPSPEGSDSLSAVLSNSTLLDSSQVELLRKNADSVYRIENPTVHSPDTIDCATCHVAQPVRNWLVSTFPSLGFQQSLYKYDSAFNLSNVSPQQNETNNLRSFGYFGKTPAFSQRVINESAAIATFLNQ